MARRNIYSLSNAEWNAIVAAFNTLKANGTYDEYVRRHVSAMLNLTLYPGETGTQRNAAHKSSAFFPWHRRQVRDFELALQAIDPSIELPYWRWDLEGANWYNAQIWGLVGGNGVASKKNAIADGPFAGWTAIIYRNGTYSPRAGIIRKFVAGRSLPSISYSIGTYDVAPWNELSNIKNSFRRRFESWHDSVHSYISGDMGAMTSPNDPIFWFHHANIDRAFAEWQTQYGLMSYLPVTVGPTGQNIDDVLVFEGPGQPTIRSVLDWRALGYTYDTVG